MTGLDEDDESILEYYEFNEVENSFYSLLCVYINLPQMLKKDQVTDSQFSRIEDVVFIESLWHFCISWIYFQNVEYRWKVIYKSLMWMTDYTLFIYELNQVYSVLTDMN